MSLATDPYVWIAAALTLGVFSFLYRDNPVFCFIEHLLVGLSTGYLFCTYWHNVFIPELVEPLWESGAGQNAHLWVVVVLCFMWACKFVDRLKDLYRLALAFWLAVELGVAIPTEMKANVLAQVAGAVSVGFDGAWHEVLGSFVLVAGTVAALTYFFFSKAHRGIVGGTARVGIWVLMIGFGATFSYTILSRIYLLVGRVLFLLRDWLGLVD
jgi:hypothetical protein